MAEIGSVRRHRLLKRLEANRQDLPGLAATWRAKQEATSPATALPVGFPFLSRLQSAGYTAQEDLAGADVDELETYLPDLSTSDAEAILAALAALTT